MLGRLSGTLIVKKPPQLLLDIKGVGYELEAPMSSFYRLPELGEEVILHTHLVVREDAQLLYGFATLEERSLFRSLIKVNGVGPKLALTILSGIEVSDFVHCIHDNDATTLVKLPGVGKKTAERLIIEMRDYLAGWQYSATADVTTEQGKLSASQISHAREEAERALIALGYSSHQASKAVAAVMQSNMDQSSEELIKQALKSML